MAIFDDVLMTFSGTYPGCLQGRLTMKRRSEYLDVSTPCPAPITPSSVVPINGVKSMRVEEACMTPGFIIKPALDRA
jgi:hypothetical protein